MYNLKMVRLTAGLSQSQLAKAAGVPVRMIQQYEAEAASAHRDINKAEALRVWKLAQALGVDIDRILEIDPEPETEEAE